MNERKFEQMLLDALDSASAELGTETGLNDARVSTFEDVGMLTRNRGLVVRLQNGAEFQLTIVQSRDAEGAAEDEADEDE